MNKFKNRYIVDCLMIPGLLLVLIFAAGCNSSIGGDGGSTENGTVDIAGRVTSLSSNDDQGLSVQSLSDGSPYSSMQLVQGAAGTVVESGGKISVNGKETNGTNDQGIYFLQEVAVNKGTDLTVSFDLDGYAGYYARVENAQPGENYSIFPVLAGLSIKEDLTAGEHRVLSDQDNNSNSVEFRQGSLEENATAEIYFGNPSTRAGALACPGGFVGVENSTAINASTSKKVDLISAGYLEIRLRDDQGERIQEISEPVNATMPLPQGFQNGSIHNPSSHKKYKAGDEIPWWSFNSTAGMWVKEPSLNATVIEKSGTLCFQARADQPGYWSAGFPMDSSCLQVQVVNQDQQGLSDVGVYAQGLTYPGITRAKTNDSGVAKVAVKSSSQDKQEKVRLYASKGKLDFLYNATESEGDKTEFVYTSENTCKELQNPIEVDSRGTVKGGVQYANSGVASGFDLYSSLGVTATTNDQGRYSLDVPLGVEVQLFAPGLEKSLTASREQQVKELDIEIPNRAPEVRSFSRTPDGVVSSLSDVNLYINATDPDPGNELTCEWNATAGSIRPKQGKEVTWTAPDTESGSAEIKVAVKDNYNGKTVEGETIAWEYYQDSSTELRVGVFRDSGFEDPVTNATVVLYKEGDTSSISSTQSTDADGMVDFGDIGRKRASISIIQKQDKNWKIETLLDIAVGDFKYNISPSVNLQNLLQDKEAEYTVNASLNKLPTGTQQTRIHPLMASKSHGDLGEYTNLGIHESAIQDNGKISLLGEAYDGSDLIGYGFFLDRSMQDGKKYDINITRDPGKINWTAKSDPVQDIYIMGKREGVTYSYLSNDNYDSPQDSGSINVPGEFPLDDWIVYAGNKRDSDTQGDAYTRLIFWDKYSNLPRNVQIQFPEYRILGLDYDPEEGRASWYIEKGETGMDVLKLSMDAAQVKWNLLKQPELYQSGVKLPALPDDVEEEIDINWENQRLNIYDFDFANGYLDFVRKYNNGTNPFNSASEYFKGYRQEPL